MMLLMTTTNWSRWKSPILRQLIELRKERLGLYGCSWIAASEPWRKAKPMRCLEVVQSWLHRWGATLKEFMAFLGVMIAFQNNWLVTSRSFLDCWASSGILEGRERLSDGLRQDFWGEVGRLSAELHSVPLELEKTVNYLLEVLLLHGFLRMG